MLGKVHQTVDGKSFFFVGRRWEIIDIGIIIGAERREFECVEIYYPLI